MSIEHVEQAEQDPSAALETVEQVARNVAHHRARLVRAEAQLRHAVWLAHHRHGAGVVNLARKARVHRNTAAHWADDPANAEAPTD